MIVVADSGPLHYLILLDHSELLRRKWLKPSQTISTLANVPRSHLRQPSATGEAGSIRRGGIDAIYRGQRGRVVHAGGYDPAGETERAHAQAA